MSEDSPRPKHGVPPSHRGVAHDEPKTFQREVWGTRAGFILAAVGSAVGLGNIWRFPYLTAEYGGAAFVVLFIVMLFLLGIPVMLAEFTIGRGTRLSPIGALRAAGGKSWTPLGYVFVFTGLLILGYYAVIAGWVTRYALASLFTGFPAAPGDHFLSIATGLPAIGFHLFFMAVVIAIVMGGVEKGIERAALIMMPTLFLLVLGLAVWAVTLEGSASGYAFYLAPSISELLDPATLTAATGQAFFSLSLGMGAMLTFSSYLSRKESLPREATVISFSDFGVAFIAGLVVFPVIFALGLQAQVDDSTVGALFIAMPGAFQAMGLVGRVVGAVFFIALFIAALTSAISLLEVVTASLIDEWRLPRKVAAVAAGSAIALIGFWPALDLAALDAMDAFSANVLLPAGALAMALFVGWLMRNPIAEVAANTSPGLRPFLTGWLWILRLLAPVLLAVVLYTSIPDVWAKITALF